MRITCLLGLGLVMVFAGPALAAPTWLAPADLAAPSDPAYPVVASDAAGETFVSWYDTSGSTTRVLLASHAPGQAWSAAAPISTSGPNVIAPSPIDVKGAPSPNLVLSPNGYGAIAWIQSDGTHARVAVARRTPGGAFGAPDVISAAGVDANDAVVAVDRSGNVQAGWIDANMAAHTRRYTAATGSWAATVDLTTAPATPANQTLWYLTIAMSPAGVATAAWSFDVDAATGTGKTSFEVQSRSQDASGAWLPMVQHSSTFSPTEAGRPQLAVADDGTTTLVWFEYQIPNPCFFCTDYTAGVVRAQTRSGISGIWQSAQTLSDPGVISDDPAVATAPDGTTTIGWTEPNANAVKVVTRPPGGAFPSAAAATIISPQDRSIQSGHFVTQPQAGVRLTSSAAGTVATFLRYDSANTLPNAVFQPAGSPWPNPTVTPPTVLSSPGVTISDDGLTAGIDGLGNIVTAWSRSGVVQAATFDAAAPTFTAIDVPASGTTGQQIAMAASAIDGWSPLAAGQPAWAFGDGGSGAGGSISHVYSAPGTYTVTVGASDLLGNATTPQTRHIVIANAPIPPLPGTTVTPPKSKIRWKSGKLSNSSLTVNGTVAAPASLTISVKLRSGGKVAVKSSFAAKAGAWSRIIKLPASLMPGVYDVTVTGPVVQPSATSFTLAAPASGIVKRTYASGPRRGPAVTALNHTSELWAHFSFAFLPKKRQKITTQWILPGGKKLAANTRPRTSLVEAQVKDLSGKSLPRGRWRCVIKVGKTVLATLNVRLK